MEKTKLVNIYLIAAFLWVLLSTCEIFLHGIISQHIYAFDIIYAAYTTIIAILAVYYYIKVFLFLVKDCKNIEE